MKMQLEYLSKDFDALLFVSIYSEFWSKPHGLKSYKHIRSQIRPYHTWYFIKQMMRSEHHPNFTLKLS